MAEENNLTANELYFSEVEDEQGLELSLEEGLQKNLVALLIDRYDKSTAARDNDEERWIIAYQNYRGQYNKTVRFRESEKSRVFVKVTKTKVLAAFGQLVDVIFGANKFPIGISATKVPEGVSEHAHLANNTPMPGIETSVPTGEGETTEDNPFDVGYAGDGKVLKPGATFDSGKFDVVPLDKALEEELIDGPSLDPTAFRTSPSQEAARRMEKLVHDQIEESNGSSEIRNSLFESALFGTGIVKGPFNFNKTLNKWEQDEEGNRTYTPVSVRVPRLEFVSIWDFFPDPNATNMDECEYVFHRHKMNRTKLRSLAKMPYFNKEAIREALAAGPNYEERDYETALKDDSRTETYGSGQFEVVEYWGVMDAEYARQVGMEISEDVDETALVGGQNMEIYPGKIFRRQAGVPGQAINGLKFPNTSTENMMMFDKFRQLADEQTGIPSYSHGMTGVQSMTRTASGMSMLLGAASLNIKTVIKNLDDFLLKPIGEAYFQWNMQFLDSDIGVEGDLEVKATGTSSLMQKEVRSQRLTTFLQTIQNPAVAPFIKVNKLISELAVSLELDPDELMNDADEAALMARIIGMQNAGQATGAEAVAPGEQPGDMGTPPGVPPESQGLGVTGTGGGNIGTGTVPQPGEGEFAGTPRAVEG